MGWNDVDTRVGAGEDPRKDPLFEDVDGLVAYYANSFVCEPEEEDVVTAISEYDDREFVAGVRSGSTRGVQFHPEKSSTKGLRIIHNFLELARDARS